MGHKAQDPGVSALSPIGTVFGHDLCNLCHRFLATVQAMCTYHNFLG